MGVLFPAISQATVKTFFKNFPDKRLYQNCFLHFFFLFQIISLIDLTKQIGRIDQTGWSDL